jgi:hypothetical protein
MRGMHRPMLYAILLVVAQVGCSPGLDWREVRPEGSTVSMLFPCKPKSQSRQALLAGAPAPMTQLSCEAQGMTFALSHAELGDPRRVSPALQAMAAALAANLQAQVVRSTPLQVPGMTPSPAARQLSLSGRLPDATPAQERAALFAHGTHVYQAAVIGPSPDSAAEIFFDSLRVLP